MNPPVSVPCILRRETWCWGLGRQNFFGREYELVEIVNMLIRELTHAIGKSQRYVSLAPKLRAIRRICPAVFVLPDGLPR